MTHVFLSYAHDDISYCERLRDDLQKSEIRVWRDLENIRKDKGWDVEIERILSSGRLTHLLYLETNQSARDDSVCRDEILYASDRGLPIIRLMFEKPFSTPLKIYRRTYIDFRKDYDMAFQQLLLELARETKTQESTLPIVLPSNKKGPNPKQIEVARDLNQRVRLIAGPGTGKSFAIEERVRWLLEAGDDPKKLYVVSFTRAASNDLRKRIFDYCYSRGQNNVNEISVTTLHSLALSVLRKAKRLNDYPVAPRVMDEWETIEIYDAEFSADTSYAPSRCEEIRLAYEAYWCTGKWDAPEYLQPEEPISQIQLQKFREFFELTTQTYACVLPGQLVKTCTDAIDAATIIPADILNARHLIVDEYQDLNYTDTQFVKSFILRNVTTYVAGDDDQSIYSFRFAYPMGIQDFTTDYKDVSEQELSECFRCTPAVLHAALTLLEQFHSPNRVQKTLFSWHEHTAPTTEGVAHRLIFRSENREAQAIAKTCRRLLDKGVSPQDIVILIANRRVQLFAKKGQVSALEKEFQDLGIPLETSKVMAYIDTHDGRLVYSLLRIACDQKIEDYLAHRTLLGLLRGVGISTCNRIRRKAISRNLNYLDLFYNPYPRSVFSGTENRALDAVRLMLQELILWSNSDTLSMRATRITEIVEAQFGKDESDIWIKQISNLPVEMNLEELRQYFEAQTDEQRANTLEIVYKRLDLDLPQTGFFSPCVRVTTIHGIKGLDAQVVFIPGIESGIIPSIKARRIAGLRLEAARLLYVAITRAKAAVVMSYATSRIINGKRENHRAPSPFIGGLGGSFIENDGRGLDDTQVNEIVKTITIISDKTRA